MFQGTQISVILHLYTQTIFNFLTNIHISTFNSDILFFQFEWKWKPVWISDQEQAGRNIDHVMKYYGSLAPQIHLYFYFIRFFLVIYLLCWFIFSIEVILHSCPWISWTFLCFRLLAALENRRLLSAGIRYPVVW